MRIRGTGSGTEEMRALDKTELQRLLGGERGDGNWWHALWVLLARGGLRRSEARRLTWADVGEYSVTVRGRTKTRESKRTVRLPPSVIEAVNGAGAFSLRWMPAGWRPPR